MKFSFLKGYRIDNLAVLFKQYDKEFVDSVEAFDIDIAKRFIAKEDIPLQQKQILKKLLNVAKNNQILVKHHCDAKIGRRYAFVPNETSLPGDKAKYGGSLMYLKKKIKNTFFTAAKWVDIDLNKAHPSIILELAKSNDLDLPFLQEYISNYNATISELMNFYSDPTSPLKQSDMKSCVTIMLFGGTFTTWKSKIVNGDEHTDPNPIKNSEIVHPILNAIRGEIDTVTSLIYNSNKGIDSLDALLCTDLAMTPTEKKNRVVSYFLQTIENHLVVSLQKELVKVKLMKLNKKSWGYDGITFPLGKLGVEEVIDVLGNINLTLQGKYDMELLEFRVKPFEEIYDDVLSTTVDGTEENSDKYNHPYYVAWKIAFQERCAYVKYSKGQNWVMKLKQTFGDMEIITYDFYDKRAVVNSDLLSSYFYTDTDGKKKKDLCINTFLTDESQEIYEFTTYIAPGIDLSLIPKEKCLNIWVDSPYQSIYYLPNNPLYLQDAVLRLLEFLKNLFPDPKSAEYIIKWIAKGIQFPASKLTCVSITGDQGTGKGTIGQLLRHLHGFHRTAQLDDPGKHLFSQFNEVREGKVLLFLDETTQQHSVEFQSQLKSLISETRTVVNVKFQSRREVMDFSKIYHASNALHSFKLEHSDRRFFVEKTSNYYRSNHEFFDSFHKMIADQTTLRSLYGFFMSLDVSEFRHEDIYSTKLRKSIIKNSVQPIDLFLIYYAERRKESLAVGAAFNNLELLWVETDAKTLYGVYQEYLKEHGSAYPAKDSSQLILQIMTNGFRSPQSVEFIRKDRGKFGFKYFFHIQNIVELFKTMYDEGGDADDDSDSDSDSVDSNPKRVKLNHN